LRPSIRAADILHVDGYQTGVPPLAAAAAIHAHTPFVVTFHGGGHRSSLRNALRSHQLQALSPLLRRADALIATARFEREWYAPILRVDAQSFELIPNGADLPVQLGAPEAAEREGLPVILSVGA